MGKLTFPLKLNAYDAKTDGFYGALLERNGQNYRLTKISEEPLADCTTYISPGWIDIHTHIYDGFGIYGINADRIGYKTGVCMVVDAGTVGEYTIENFKTYVAPSIRTNYKLFLCISAIGTTIQNENRALEYLNPVTSAEIIEKNRDIICGAKVRMGNDVITDEGNIPMERAAELARMVDLPLMVHIGGTDFPAMEPCFQKGDIITHVFNNRGYDVFDEEGNITPAFQRCLDKGVRLDVGHGVASFNFNVFERAYSKNKGKLPRFFLGTDLHNMSIKRCCYSMSNLLTKMVGLGLPLHDIMWGVTEGPAQVLQLQGWCALEELKNATLFDITSGEPERFEDANGNVRYFDRFVNPRAVFLKGEYIEL